MTFDVTESRQGTSMPPSPSPSPGGTTTLATVDIVVLVVYFLLILAVGLWVSTGEKTGLCSNTFTKHFYIVSLTEQRHLEWSTTSTTIIGFSLMK